MYNYVYNYGFDPLIVILEIAINKYGLSGSEAIDKFEETGLTDFIMRNNMGVETEHKAWMEELVDNFFNGTTKKYDNYNNYF